MLNSFKRGEPMEQISKYINVTLKTIVGVILSFLILLVFGNALLRYLFNSGIVWSEELARYLFVWLVFLGAVLAYRDKEHIIVDVLVLNVPRPLQKILYIISNVIVCISMIMFLYGLTLLIEMNAGILGPATGLPVNLLYFAGMVCAIAVVMITILQTYHFFKGTYTPQWFKKTEVEEDEIS